MNRARSMAESIQAKAFSAASLVRNARLEEGINPGGLYSAQCWRPVPARLDEFIHLRDALAGLKASPVLAGLGRTYLDGLIREIIQIQARLAEIPKELVWDDSFRNTVVTEGKNAILTHFLKGSTYTASQVLGLIEDAGYSAISATNTAANITAAAGGSPTNGWNEAQSSTCAARQTPSFGTASSGSLAASATSHSILATDTIKGAFLLARSTAGTAPSTTVGNTSGALYSAGLFSGGDKAVANGDTLSVTYTASA